MFELAVSIASTTLAPGQFLPGISNSQLLVIGQIIIGLLITASILLQMRNYRIGKLLIRDKTMMFAGFVSREDYERVVKEKGHVFRLISESEVREVKETNGHNSGVREQPGIVPDEKDGHLKVEDNNFTDGLNK